MRKELLLEVENMIRELEEREFSVQQRMEAVTQREANVTHVEEKQAKRAVEIEEMERKAQNVLDATSNIRQELALRKARIKTLEDEAVVRETRLAEARAEKGRLKEELNRLMKSSEAVSA